MIQFIKWISWILCITFAVPIFAQERLVLEAEDFDGLLYFTFHNVGADGWYAREANCRFYGTLWGNGKTAAIHATAKEREMHKTLDTPLPAGEYRVTVRVAGTTLAEKLGRDNVLRVSFGEAFKEFRWRNVGRRFKWLPMEEVALNRPASVVRVSAVQFGGGGLVHLNEPQTASLWLDTIYITSDPEENTPPSPERERSVKFGLSALPLPEKERPLVHERFEPPEQFVAQPIKLRSFDGRKNIFPNGSFELGMNGGWAATNTAYKHCYIFTDDDLDEDSPAHGLYALRVPPDASPLSRPLQLDEGGEMTLSVFLRSEGPQKVSVQLCVPDLKQYMPSHRRVLSMDCPVTEKWQRFSVSGEVPSGLLYLRLKNAQQLWVDGVQLERGDLSPFQPRAELEGSLSTGQIGNVITTELAPRKSDEATPKNSSRDSSPAKLSLWFHNSSPRPQSARLKYRIINLWERVAAEGLTAPVTVPANSTMRVPFPVNLTERGIFSAWFAMNERQMPEGELVFVVTPPPPKGQARHELAANMDMLAHPYRLMAQMGFSWQLYCKFYPTFPDRALPEPEKWKWFDDTVALAGQCGLKTLACLWPSRVRPFMRDVDKVPGETMGITRNMQRSYPNLSYPDISSWSEYVRDLVQHYRSQIRWWCVEDETELYFTPAEFAPIMRAVHDAVKSVDESMKVGTSMCPQYHEELLQLAGDSVDFLGASSWGASYWEARKIRWLQVSTGKPWLCIGVGLNNQPTFYHSLPEYRPALRDAASTAQEIVKLCVVQDAKVIGHYTGRIWNRAGHRNGDFPLVDYDGTPLPHGVVYAIVGRLLADASPAGEVAAGNGLWAFLFEQGGRVHAVTWSGAPAGLYGHNVQTPSTALSATRRLTLRLPNPKERLRLTDPFGNDRTDAQWQDNQVTVELTPMPLLLWNLQLSRAELEKTLRNAVLSPELIVGRMAVAPNPRDAHRLDLVVQARWNGSANETRPNAIEIGTAPGQLMTDNQWLLVERRRQIREGDWDGNECVIRFPTVLSADMLRHPLENAQLYAWALRSVERAASLPSGEVVGGFLDTLWVATARKMGQVKLDGDLREWRKRSAAWLDYSFSWARFGRWLEQVEKGGEYLIEYMSDADFVDSRVGFWCGWDDAALYFAAEVFDEQQEEDDGSLILHLWDDPLAPATRRTVTVPLKNGAVKAPEGSGFVSRVQEGWTVEVRLDWKALGVKRHPVLGLDVRYVDHDMVGGKPTTSVLRWAGASSGGCLWLLP